MMSFKFFTAILIFSLVQLSDCLCPQDCTCPLDERGRRQVVCDQGGMVGLPITQMDAEIEIIRISAPADFQNSLTIGPIFRQFTHLEEVHIVRSNIPAIGIHSFWGLPSLHVLNLSQNNISHVLDSHFRGLANLLQLNLDENKIEAMPSGTFRHLHELRHLSLSHNKVNELKPRIFLKLAKLHDLDLSYNPLHELNPEVFKDVMELRIFRCRACHLSNINTLIYRYLSDLEYLDLGENEFKYIASDEFHSLRKLKILKLDGNLLPVVLEKTFGNIGGLHGKYSQGQVDLQEIDLSRNRLAKITSLAFANLTTLRSLDISYNKLDRLDTLTFLPLTDSLISLNLSGNNIQLQELKHILQIVSGVKALSLADLTLTEIPAGLFLYFENLRFLNLSGNQLAYFSPQILSPVPRLFELDLTRNRFRGLDEKLLLRLELIKILHLTANPWACDLCHTPPILERVNKSNMVLALKDLTCKSPYALAGRTIASLQRSELRWCSSGSQSGDENTGAVGIPRSFLPDQAQIGLIAAVCTAVVLMVGGIAVSVCIAYSKHRTSHYYTHEDQRTESESIFENPQAVGEENGENGNVYKMPIEINKSNKKKVSIATIDEITKDPELHVLTNGT